MRQSTPLAEEWVEAIDSQTGEKCWRSNVTGETLHRHPPARLCSHDLMLGLHRPAGEFTRPGLTKPHTWHEVVDKGSGLLYYWCPATG